MTTKQHPAALLLLLCLPALGTGEGEGRKACDVGACKPCQAFPTLNQDSSKPCVGYRQALNCTLMQSDGTAIEKITEYVQCNIKSAEQTELDESDNYFWYFEVAMTLLLATSAYIVRRRKRVSQKIREARFSKMVND
mmetsp:Transcript_26857/g.43180  ORF Transcript_26857/g.43180 Transcript_26857/m.43180 type:complete len:137 (-) Transcript_26857:426-836(-)